MLWVLSSWVMAPTPTAAPDAMIDAALGDAAVTHLQALLRIDTTNPPGGETAAAEQF